MLTQLCICLLSPASNGGVDINLELWPASVRAAKNLALGNATYKGLLGYNGRSGWFVAERSFSQDALNQTAFGLLNETTGDVEEVQVPGYDAFRGYWPLFDYRTLQELLMRADAVPDELLGSTCAIKDNSYQVEPTGRYICEQGTWVPPASQCCPRGTDPASCEEGVMACRVIVADNPFVDPGMNEAIIIKSGMPLQIIYADLDAMVALSVSMQAPVFIHSWEPDGLIASKKQGEFVRINFIPSFYADPASTGTYLGPESEYDTLVSDFPEQPIEKLVNDQLCVAEPDACASLRRAPRPVRIAP